MKGNLNTLQTCQSGLHNEFCFFPYNQSIAFSLSTHSLPCVASITTPFYLVASHPTPLIPAHTHINHEWWTFSGFWWHSAHLPGVLLHNQVSLVEGRKRKLYSLSLSLMHAYIQIFRCLFSDLSAPTIPFYPFFINLHFSPLCSFNLVFSSTKLCLPFSLFLYQ